jgi:hypothetical protein
VLLWNVFKIAQQPFKDASASETARLTFSSSISLTIVIFGAHQQYPIGAN